MSRFVRLSEGHYINLDLVTDIILSDMKQDGTYRLIICNAVTDNTGGQIEQRLCFNNEAEARAELARILPESTWPESANEITLKDIDGAVIKKQTEPAE